MSLTAAEQLFLELVNRARLDPEAEAVRQKIPLNQGVSREIDDDAKQALAPNSVLERAAEGHSRWMLDTDTFSHTGLGGSSPKERIEAAGYRLSGDWATGENLSVSATTARINLNTVVKEQFDSLYASPSHRLGMMNEKYRETGVAQVEGIYTDRGTNFNASMITQKFGATGTQAFVTGVIYQDQDSNNFYSVGEGRGGVAISSGNARVQSAAAGGYGLGLRPGEDVAVAIGGARLRVDLSDGNVKVDLVNGNRIFTSGDTTLVSGVREAQLLGVEDLTLRGSGAAEILRGNSGENELFGGAGNDTLHGGTEDDYINGGIGADVSYLGGGNDKYEDTTDNGALGADSIHGGAGNDWIHAGGGPDTVHGDTGNDTIFGGTGHDRLYGGDGLDLLNGGLGNDHIWGGSGNDRVNGGAGADQTWLGSGNDRYEDTTDNGALGADTVHGGDGNDWIHAGGGPDLVHGDGGNDTIYGGTGHDRLHGDAGADQLYGGLGNDRLYGGAGNDLLSGGAGTDVFIFRNNEAGADRITDFNLREDTLQLDKGLWSGALNAGQVVSRFASVTAEGVVLDFGAETILLEDLRSTTGLAASIDIL